MMPALPSHPVLDSHKAIAWDIDGTLIDNVNSPFLRDYIRAHRGKRHHVVTHRRVGYGHLTEAMLAGHGLTPGIIAGVHYCPDAYRDAYEHNGDPELVALFHAWKGAKAAELGCGILIDDVPDLCEAGCIATGVAFLNSWCCSFPRDPNDE
jgi:phosphoglycolate phosphatase-like HAD superfamily hydrolase